jgi:hypothetical protein
MHLGAPATPDHPREMQRLLVLLGRPAERRQLVARDLQAEPGADLVVIAEGQLATPVPSADGARLVT